jgi:hypothetical protein
MTKIPPELQAATERLDEDEKALDRDEMSRRLRRRRRFRNSQKKRAHGGHRSTRSVLVSMKKGRLSSSGR